MLKIDLFWIFKVKWLHQTGEVDKSVRCSCQNFSGFNLTKINKSVIFNRIIQKNKRMDVFLGHRVYSSSKHVYSCERSRTAVQFCSVHML